MSGLSMSPTVTPPVNNVLSDGAPITQSSYRAVVASIVNAVKAELHESDQDMADRLGVSATTINNASNKRGDLASVTMLRLGQVYGIHRLDAVANLIGAKLAQAGAHCTSDAELPIGVALGQLFLARALADERIDDDEILDGAGAIEALHQVGASLKWRLDGIRARRERG